MSVHHIDLLSQASQLTRGLIAPATTAVERVTKHVSMALRVALRSVRPMRTLLSTTILAGYSSAVLAQDSDAVTLAPRLFTSSETIGYSIILGTLCAALLSVVWLVRQRGNIENEFQDYRSALSDAQQDISKYQALISDNSRRIVLWEDETDRPQFLGELPTETGAPQSNMDFLAFGKWLKPNSAGQLEKAIEALRSIAQSFDLTVETQRGEVLEVQGRVSGGKAFARFVALNNLRAELAELKLEREQLVASIETFQALLDNMEQPVWRRDPQGKLTWVNHSYATSVDANTPDQAVREQRELLPTVTRQKIRASATLDSPYHDRISSVVAGNRAFLDVLDVKSIYGSAGIAIDATETETIREELKRTFKSHAETLDHLASPVAIFDGEQRLQFYNQAFMELWGLDLVFLESKPGNSELFDRLRAGNKLPAELNWKSWKDQALSVYRALDTRTDLWHLPDARTLRVISTAHPQGGATWVFENLTEQVDLQTRYNTLVKVQGETIDHLAEGVAVFGADGRLSISNPAFRILWGITAEQSASGTHINAIQAACTNEYEAADGWKAFTRFITSFEDERKSLQGTLELNSGIVLNYAVIPLPDSQTMLTFVDMTDSVRAERALTEKNEALRLAHALKNDFVHHISYELRSPLTNIIGFTDLLKTPEIGHLNERQGEYLEHISTSSSVLLTYVNDILDLATVDAGIMQLNLSDRDLNSLIDEVAEQITDKLHDSNVQLEILAPTHLGILTADHQRLKQILLKLLNNATNFAPEGSTIKLTCQRSESDFVFTVEDSGPGIPADILASVFDKFASRGNGGRKTGPGLGLSIVERFVKLHDGEVSIDSRPGEGTLVKCRIPNGRMRNPYAAE
jgi:signal transduction histidine kinase